MSNMVVNTNVLALNSHRNIGKVGRRQQVSSQRLSSGLRVNSAADDAAGLSISEKMRAQIRGLDQASKNAQDGQSLIQTAEGGLQEIDNMVQRIRELVVQVSNDTNEQTMGSDKAQGDRQKIQDEIEQLVAEIDSMSERVEFNKKKVLNGDYMEAFSEAKGVAEAEVALIDGEIAYNKLTTEASSASSKASSAKNSVSSIVNSLAEDIDAVIKGMGYGDPTTVNAIKSLLDSAIGTDDTSGIRQELKELDFGMTSFTSGTSGVTILKEDDIKTALEAVLVETGETDKMVAGDVREVMKLIKSANREIKSLNNNLETLATKNKEVEKYEDTLDELEDDLNTAMENFNKADKKGGIYFQIGANAQQGFSVSIGASTSDFLGIGDGKGAANINVVRTTGEDITGMLDRLDYALTHVTTERSKLGAVENRLEYTMNSLDISSENLSAAESRIRDTDMAAEMMELTQANVLQQAATAMLAQANQAPQSVLQLLQ